MIFQALFVKNVDLRILVFTAYSIVTVYVEFIFPFSRENFNSHERCFFDVR
jgi:hypothetical protein